VVKLLLEANADTNASGESCGTPLQIAAFKGYESIVQQLLRANADVNLHCDGDFGNVRYPRNEFGFSYQLTML